MTAETPEAFARAMCEILWVEPSDRQSSRTGETYLQYWSGQAVELLARGITSTRIKGAVHGVSILEWDVSPEWPSRRHQALAMAVEALRYGMP